MQSTDEWATRFATQKLEELGWNVVDLNVKQANHPNSDLKITRGGGHTMYN